MAKSNEERDIYNIHVVSFADECRHLRPRRLYLRHHSSLGIDKNRLLIHLLKASRRF